MNKAGNIAGPLLGYEVLTAFFLEATFLGVMLFGRERVPAWMHTLSAFLVAIGTSASAFWILALNSWMQTPQGFEVIDGQLHAILDVDAECGVRTREGARHRDRHRRARRLSVPSGIGGFHAFGRLHLGAVLVDLYLLDDLQVGLRFVAFWGGLIAAGNAQHNQARTTESKCTTCHATSHVPPPSQSCHRHRGYSARRPSPDASGRT